MAFEPCNSIFDTIGMVPSHPRSSSDVALQLGCEATLKAYKLEFSLFDSSISQTLCWKQPSDTINSFSIYIGGRVSQLRARASPVIWWQHSAALGCPMLVYRLVYIKVSNFFLWQGKDLNSSLHNPKMILRAAESMEYKRCWACPWGVRVGDSIHSTKSTYCWTTIRFRAMYHSIIVQQ